MYMCCQADKARVLEQDDPYSNKIYYTYGTEFSPLTVKDKPM